MTLKRVMRGMLAAAFVAGCVCGDSAAAAKRRWRDVEGAEYYTRNNIWYKHPAKIFNVNYHVGKILPLATKVTIKRMRKGHIDFTVDGVRQVFRIYWVRKFAARRTTVWDFFDQYFASEDPLIAGGAFDSISGDELDLIKQGKIALGMSKWAVLRSYGYPPGHRTPSWKADTWIYWVSRRATRKVHFTDERVSKIER